MKTAALLLLIFMPACARNPKPLTECRFLYMDYQFEGRTTTKVPVFDCKVLK